MHRKVNIQQYVKTPSGRWQWESIPKNPRTGHYLWVKTKSSHFYLVWRERNKKRYEKAGASPSEVLEAKRRKEFELAGRAILESGRKLERPREHGLTVEPAIEKFLDFIKNKKRPNTHKRYRIVMDHVKRFFRSGTPLDSITAADIDAFRDERLKEKNPWEGSITPRNVNYEVSVIRTFFYYLHRFHDPDLKNPAANMKNLAVTKTIVDSYDEGELKAFFKACIPMEKAIFKMFGRVKSRV